MKKKSEESAQIVFMQRVKSVLPSSISLVNELSDLLKISNDSAYRRIRGESALTIEEITLLCKHFKLSFDSFINNRSEHSVTFSYQPFNGNANSFALYLQNMKTNLETVLKYPSDQQQIIFAAEDVPIFHHFAHPDLTTFKLFYWDKSILNAPGFEDKKFELVSTDPLLKELAKEIYELYAKIPCIEIWTDNTVNSTLKQIEFYWDSGVFLSKEDALLICGEVNQMLLRICRQAELNVKLDLHNKPVGIENSYLLYHSDVMIGNNCILTQMGNSKETYISYHTFNSMATTNDTYCNETEWWLKNLIRKSNLISGVGEKQRYRYFKIIDDALKKLIAKIENG
jgi:hypothetical protein